MLYSINKNMIMMMMMMI